jgi:hypothetical protein
VDGGASEPALQRAVGLAMAERDAVASLRDLRSLDAFDLAAQNRKRACTCAAHARRSFGMMAVALKKRNQRLAHLFMICSNIKLTAAEESIGLRILRFVSGIKGIQIWT